MPSKIASRDVHQVIAMFFEMLSPHKLE